ncbi:Dolichyl-phosphate-mannose--protein mannosyltransferase family GT39 [Gracilaria domingensis]|nr:Dolichyl-phosphate-mannose--protein mannosyltransferase family GT39 [Gracilaria domingensis]
MRVQKPPLPPSRTLIKGACSTQKSLEAMGDAPPKSQGGHRWASNTAQGSSSRRSPKPDTKAGGDEFKDTLTSHNGLRQSFAAARDNYIQWSLLIIAWFIRFYRLGEPAAVVFDEYHFGTFVDNIISGATHFDIHPPLGKLTLAFFGWHVGYRPDPDFGYEEIGKAYNSVLYYPLREVAAVFGVITVPLMYATARTLGMSWVGALVCAGLFCFDNLNIIESRLILMDSQITFYLVLSLYCAFKLWKTAPRTWSRFFWLTATGFVCGCSISVKWTALATPGLIAIVSFFALHFLDEPLTFLECAWAAFVGLGWYAALFYVHFQTLTHTGPGVGFFRSSFKATLIGEPNYDPEAKRDPFHKLFFYLNKYMFTANAGITTRHHWESYWYQWIVNWRGLLYYNKEVEGKWASVYLHCNPIALRSALQEPEGFQASDPSFVRFGHALWDVSILGLDHQPFTIYSS